MRAFFEILTSPYYAILDFALAAPAAATALVTAAALTAVVISAAG